MEDAHFLFFCRGIVVRQHSFVGYDASVGGENVEVDIGLTDSAYFAIVTNPAYFKFHIVCFSVVFFIIEER